MARGRTAAAAAHARRTREARSDLHEQNTTQGKLGGDVGPCGWVVKQAVENALRSVVTPASEREVTRIGADQRQLTVLKVAPRFEFPFDVETHAVIMVVGVELAQRIR